MGTSQERAGRRVSVWLLAALTCWGLFLRCPPLAAAQDLRAGVEQLATRIMEATSEASPLRIAVTDFPDLQNVTSDLGRYIANRLTTRLAQSPKFSVVERQRLGQVLAELKFGMSDLVDPTKAKRLGQIAGVEALVVGTVSDLGNQVDIDIRLIEVNTSRMILGTTTTISKDQVVTQLLERGRETATLGSPAGTGASSSSPSSTSSASVPGPRKVQEFPKFRVEVERLQVASNGTVTLFLAYTNKTREDLQIGLCWARDQTFLIDPLGDRYGYTQSSLIGDVCLRRPESALTLSADSRVVAAFSFQKQYVGTRDVSLLSLTSQQIIVTTDTRGYHLQSTHNIYISDIKAQ